MGYKVKGRLHATFDTQQVTERFRKRELVLELGDNPRYPQYVLFQLTGDRCEKLDGLRAGDEVEIDFSLRGREWTSPKGEVKYFNSLDVWEIEGAGTAPRGPDDAPPNMDEPPPGFDDDTPF